jgi:uncharacterized protein (DUF885 family)
MRKLINVLPLSTITLALLACSPQSTEQTQTTSQVEQSVTQTESEKLAQYFAKMFEQDLKRSPQKQSELGYKWDYDKWNDISEATQEETRVIQQKRLVTLNNFNLSQLSSQEKLSI